MLTFIQFLSESERQGPWAIFTIDGNGEIHTATHSQLHHDTWPHLHGSQNSDIPMAWGRIANGDVDLVTDFGLTPATMQAREQGLRVNRGHHRDTESRIHALRSLTQRFPNQTLRFRIPGDWHTPDQHEKWLTGLLGEQ